MADRSCRHPDGRSWRSWGVLGGNSARDGCEFVTELAAWGFSPFPEG